MKNKNEFEKGNFERFSEITPCSPLQTSTKVLIPVVSLINVAVSRIQKTPITTKRRTNNISLKRKWIYNISYCFAYSVIYTLLILLIDQAGLALEFLFFGNGLSQLFLYIMNGQCTRSEECNVCRKHNECW